MRWKRCAADQITYPPLRDDFIHLFDGHVAGSADDSCCVAVVGDGIKADTDSTNAQ